MAIGPALIISALGLLALSTVGKKSGGSPDGSGAPPLPPNPTGTGSHPTTARVVGPMIAVLPDDLADLIAKSLKDLTINDDGSVSGPVTPEAVQRATTVAAQVENAGFPDAAKTFRAFIQAASRKVPSPAPDKQVKLPGVSQATVDAVNRAVQLERDPAKLQAILSQIQGLPQSAERDLLIEMLSNTIKQVQATIVLADTLKKTDTVLTSPGIPQPNTLPTPVIQTQPQPSAPTPQPQPQPTMVLPPMVVTASNDIPDSPEKRRAVNTANHLINKVADNGGVVKNAKGKEDKSIVMAFQKGEGLTADGKTGPGTVLKMAKYTGDIPYVYYWPVSATQKNVLDYRTTLRDMADVHEQAGRQTIADKLRSNASRERGQAGIVGQMPA